MGLTVEQLHAAEKLSVDGLYLKLFRVDFDSSYPTDGEALTAATLGFEDLAADLIVSADPKDGYTFDYVGSAAKLIARAPGALGVTKQRMKMKDNDSAASAGIAVYVHVDETIEQGSLLCHLESVTAGNADTYVQMGVGGPALMIQDDDLAATGGLQLYFDEDATLGSRLIADFDRPGDVSAFVMLSNGQRLRITDVDTPGTPGVAVYCDDDAANAYDRFQFVSPTNADGSEAFWGEGAGQPTDGSDLSYLTDVIVRVYGRNPA